MRPSLPRWIMLAVLFFTAWTGIPIEAAAQQATPEEAFAAALAAYNAATGQNFAIQELRQESGLAYATAGPVQAADDLAAEAGFAALIAEDLGASGWRALAPEVDPPGEYNRLLERFPDTLLDEALKARFRQPDAASGEAGALLLAANFTGHRLPWPYLTKAYVTQKDSYSGHMNQIDFDIGGLAVPNGDVYATKPGRVVFVKDSSNVTCRESTPLCLSQFNVVVVEHGPSEYSWYLHLVYGSAAVEVGQQVGFGTKLGLEGNTGYSTGVHLHYMVSTGHTAWTDPTDPNKAPWGLGMAPVDFDEYTWADLVPRYDFQYTSQNGANLPPVCPAAGGGLLFRDVGYSCAGLLENSGYILQNEAGFQNLDGFNDLASSAVVPAGGSMMLYEHGDRTGGETCLNASDSSFAGDTFDNGVPLNDGVSSFEVFNEPDCPVRTPADLTAPGGGLTAPASGATVGRSLALTSNASDGQSGVQMVRFTAKWGGQERVLYTDTSAPYRYDWDLCAAGVPDGSLEINQTVFDWAWNSTTALPVSVTKAYDCAGAPSGAWSVDAWANTGLSGPAAFHAEQAGTFLFQDWGASSPGPGLPADGWSARFTRSFTFAGGDYRFHCQSAGGCRLRIDGQARIETWQDTAFAEADWSGALPAGDHTITVEFFDASGDARLEAWWQGPGFLPQEQACAADQWCASIWGNPTLSGSPAVKLNVDETLRYAWGNGGPYALLPADRFSARYTRAAQFDCGAYQFTLGADGPARLWLDGELLIDQWVETGTSASYNASRSLARGAHDLVVEQADLSGAAGISLSWSRQSSCAVSAAVESVSTHIARPNTRFEPSLRARVADGYLNPARGDGLSFVSGNSFSAGPGLVRRVVEAGQIYTFDESNGFTMIAPGANGLHSGQWQIQAGGSAASAPVSIQVMVDGSAPQVSFSAPGGAMRTSSVPVRVNTSDAHSGISHVQFLVWANSGGGLAWHNLGWDTNGADGWGVDWNATGFADQTGVVVLAAAWDKAGNYAEARTGGLALDRNAPAVGISGPAAVQESTRFLVQWSGSDVVSGMHHFDVQVMVDGGAAQDWLMGVSPGTTSSWFTGEMGHRYAFRARAVDNAGNASAYTAPTTPAEVRACTPDAAEPDSTSAQARSLPPGLAGAPRNLCGVGDTDWYVFQAAAGQHYLLATQALGETTDTVLTLYAADGQTILAERDNASASDKASILVWKASADGPLYFRVRHADPRVAGNAVTYTPRVDPVKPFFMPFVSR